MEYQTRNVSHTFIDSWVWEVKHQEASRLLSRYLKGSISYVDFKIKLFYLKKEAMLAHQTKLELFD